MAESTREQQLVNLMFNVAFVAAESMHGRSHADVAAWVAKNLAGCGFPTRQVGSSWGVLTGA